MTAEVVHSLWTAAALVLAAALAAGRLRAHRAQRAGHRRRRAVLGGPGRRPTPGHSRRAPDAGRRRPGPGHRPAGSARRRRRRRVAALPAPVRGALAACGTGALVAVLAGGVTGTLAGLAAACGLWWWPRVRAAGPDRRAAAALERAVAAQLPLAAELVAACLAAGSSPLDAARAVGSCLGGPLGDRLTRTCDELRLGAEPARAWARLAELPGAGVLARCLERAHGSGAPAVAQVGRLAAECRAGWARAAQARARRAGVLVTGPLALCFLPAFLLVGVAPVVVGLGRSLL
ncbi:MULTISPECIES: type II secretion system F family protein [Streptomyces]|uniref:type II secretion system F family protein n=1 Tax=Streptomyces TaxID=1883 RepID=UPI0022493514|nr:type II secretion system F family protein [Streptomyces sp. JHD 1]MCX2970536.1 type II secretion system F family protein [Streptomyces sp. JHD 1]